MAKARLRDDHAMLILSEFLKSDCNARKTRDAVNRKMEEHDDPFRITREQVYPAFRIAIQRGFVRVTPPFEHRLAERIVARYGHHGDEERFRVSDIHVSKSRGNLSYVASSAADVVIGLIRVLQQRKERVHIGLGAGMTSMYFAQHFAQALRYEEDLPKIGLHALTAGFDAHATELSPESSFGLFQQSGLDLSYCGMPAPPLVPAREYQKALESAAVRIPFQEKHKIDVVVTALASADDEHGCLKRFFEVGGQPRPAGMDRVIGDIQYCLFTEKGPLRQRSGLRAVTLFELDELRELAQQDGKYVVLIAGPCNVCGETREAALKPVMSNDALKVWTHLVCDLATAEKLVSTSVH